MLDGAPRSAVAHRRRGRYRRRPASPAPRLRRAPRARLQRVEVEVGPLGAADRARAGWRAWRSVPVSADDVGLGGADELLELGARSPGSTGGSVARPRSRSSSAIWRATSQFTGPRRLQHAHQLGEVEVSTHRRRGSPGGPGKPGKRRRVRSPGSGSFGLGRPPRRSLQVEEGRPRGQSMDVLSVAVTGASGLVGQRLLPRLAERRARRRGSSASTCASRRRRVRSLEFHRVDIGGAELKPLLEGVDVLVHLAAVVDPIADEALMARVNVEGTRRVLDAAAAVGVRKVVRVSSAAVYGAWANNPVPLTEDAPLRPNPGFAPAVQAAEVERLLAEWHEQHPGVTVTTLRSAPVMGPGPNGSPSRLLLGRPPLRVRGADAAGAGGARRRPRRRAGARGARATYPGTFNVAADGWLAPTRSGRCSPRSLVPGASRPSCSSAASAGCGRAASATSRRASCRTSCTPGSSPTTASRRAGWQPAATRTRRRSSRRSTRCRRPRTHRATVTVAGGRGGRGRRRRRPRRRRWR